MRNKTSHTVERLSLPENPHVVRWLRPLLHQQLGRSDVFVPDWVSADVVRASPLPARRRVASVQGAPVCKPVVPPVGPTCAFYFTVPSEYWSVLCVAGSAMTEADRDARVKMLEKQHARATSKEAKHSAAIAFRTLNRHVRRGLVPHAELQAQREVFRDESSTREAWGKFRVYRSNPSNIDELAERFEQMGYVVVPILPAFSWRDVEFPHDDERYRVPMVHAQTRAPCPWSKRSLSRRLYCRG
ncbi:hypothetical protein [Paraburkholderia sp. C35]|uniref:hypothetical protein n=1 Tax=Paraburkholderia sp. C35 TaxID=2126993 RepID=UPI000D69A117|nr:hypothetical protein [Paraburkholderia sp. C35]